MARVNVEQKALTDPRFWMLGELSGAPPEYCQAVGLLLAIRIWNECIERETDILRGEIAQALMQDTAGAQRFVDCDLAEWVDELETMIRVKGCTGRTDYKAKIRAGNRAGGISRASSAERDEKTGTFTRSNQVESRSSTRSNPGRSSVPAPAPSPESLQDTPQLLPASPSRSANGTPPPGFAAWWEELRPWFRAANRRLGYKAEALKLWKSKGCEAYTDEICTRTAALRNHYLDAQSRRQDPPPPQDPHRFLRNRRYNDEVPK